MTHTKTLSTSHASKTLGERTLWSLSLDFAPGTMTSIVGPSGSGKTTLLNCLGLLDPLSSGSISYGDRQIQDSGAAEQRRLRRESFGYLFQNYALVEQWSVQRNLLLPLRRLPVSSREREARIAKALRKVGLRGREKSPVHSLSGGEQQRVALARLTLHEPDVVFVDEPTASLDDANADLVLAHLMALAEGGATVIVSTHDPRFQEISHATVELG